MKYLTLFFVLVLTGCATSPATPRFESKSSNSQQTDGAPPKGAEALSAEYQRWLHQSCSRSLGPSLWSKCVEKETKALKSGEPDISKLSFENQKWIESSCSRSLGPSLAIKCMEREKAAIEAGMPDLSDLSQEQKLWLEDSCSKSLGPSLYRSCMNRESSALSGGNSLLHKTPAQTEKSPRQESYAKEWSCIASFGGEVVVKLAFSGEEGFVTMLDEKYEGRYDTDGLTRIWYFGEAEDPDYYRYSIALNARGIARLFQFSGAEEEGNVTPQETLRCTRI
jgi:hypothetical protein